MQRSEYELEQNDFEVCILLGDVTLLDLDWKMFIETNPMVGGILLTLVMLNANGLLLTCLWVGVCLKWKRGQVTAPRPVPTVNPRSAKSNAGVSRPVPTANPRSAKSNADPKQGCSGGGLKVNPVLVIEAEVKKGVAGDSKASKKGIGNFFVLIVIKVEVIKMFEIAYFHTPTLLCSP
jgi:hypothetical protein